MANYSSQSTITPVTPVCDVPPLAVNTADAARLLGVAPNTLRNWRNMGVGPEYIRIYKQGKTGPKKDARGSRVLYPYDSLRSWLDAQQRVGGC